MFIEVKEVGGQVRLISLIKIQHVTPSKNEKCAIIEMDSDQSFHADETYEEVKRKIRKEMGYE